MLCKELSTLLEDGNFWKVTVANVVVLSVLQAWYQTFEAVDYAETISKLNVVLCFLAPCLTIIGVILFIIFATPLNQMKLITRSVCIIIGITILYCFESMVLTSDTSLTSYVIFRILACPFYGGILIGVFELQAEATFPHRVTFGFAIMNTAISTTSFFIRKGYETCIKRVYSYENHNIVLFIGFLTVLLLVIALVIYMKGNVKLARLLFEGQLWQLFKFLSIIYVI